jgi:hypothetical protein
VQTGIGVEYLLPKRTVIRLVEIQPDRSREQEEVEQIGQRLGREAPQKRDLRLTLFELGFVAQLA